MKREEWMNLIENGRGKKSMLEKKFKWERERKKEICEKEER